MNKTTQKINLKDIMDIVDNNSSEWDDLCNKCSFLVKEAGITEERIDEIVRKCKKV